MAIKAHLRLAQFDTSLRQKHGLYLCGVDEAGRGAWSGPISAGAVVLPEGVDIPHLNDSKKLTATQRATLAPLIKDIALAWSVAFVSAREIDVRGLTWANKEVMRLASVDVIEQIKSKHNSDISFYMVDQCAGFALQPYKMMPKADGTSLSVAAAAVLAKTTRDQFMDDAHHDHPEYNWADNKGYINEEHKNAVLAHGRLKDWHRFSYKVKGVNAPRQVTLNDLDLEE